MIATKEDMAVNIHVDLIDATGEYCQLILNRETAHELYLKLREVLGYSPEIIIPALAPPDLCEYCSRNIHGEDVVR